MEIESDPSVLLYHLFHLKSALWKHIGVKELVILTFVFPFRKSWFLVEYLMDHLKLKEGEPHFTFMSRWFSIRYFEGILGNPLGLKCEHLKMVRTHYKEYCTDTHSRAVGEKTKRNEWETVLLGDTPNHGDSHLVQFRKKVTTLGEIGYFSYVHLNLKEPLLLDLILRPLTNESFLISLVMRKQYLIQFIEELSHLKNDLMLKFLGILKETDWSYFCTLDQYTLREFRFKYLKLVLRFNIKQKANLRELDHNYWYTDAKALFDSYLSHTNFVFGTFVYSAKVCTSLSEQLSYLFMMRLYFFGDVVLFPLLKCLIDSCKFPKEKEFLIVEIFKNAQQFNDAHLLQLLHQNNIAPINSPILNK